MMLMTTVFQHAEHLRRLLAPLQQKESGRSRSRRPTRTVSASLPLKDGVVVLDLVVTKMGRGGDTSKSLKPVSREPRGTYR
jgi:hypothetical protein